MLCLLKPLADEGGQALVLGIDDPDIFVVGQLLIDDMGCQAGVGPAKLTTMMIKLETDSIEGFESIKLGIDARAKCYFVARQVDGATPQPVQKMTLPGLLRFIAKQKRMCRKLYTCYEAGAFGYP